MKKPMPLLLTILMIILLQNLILPASIFEKKVNAEEISVLTNNGDAVSILGDITIDKNTSGDVFVILGSADIRADVDGDVFAVLGNISVDARISGQVVSILGNVNLTDKAEVGRDIISIGTVEKAMGARLYGQEIVINTGIFVIGRAFLSIIFSFFTLILGLALITVSRQRFNYISKSVEANTGKKLLTGFVGFMVCSVLMVVLFITIIGPLAYMVVLVLAEITASIYFGKHILKVINLNLNVFMEFITGLISIMLLKIAFILVLPQHDMIVYSVLYTILALFINSLGIGLLIDSKSHKARSEKNSKPVLATDTEPGYADRLDFDDLDLDLNLEGSENDRKK